MINNDQLTAMDNSEPVSNKGHPRVVTDDQLKARFHCPLEINCRSSPEKKISVLESLNRLKGPLEIAGIAVGLALGAITLWQQVRPNQDLIATVVVTDALPPADLIERFESLPARVKDDLQNDRRVAELLPNADARAEVAAAAAEVIRKRAPTPLLGDFEQMLYKSLVTVVLRNEGRKTLRSVRMTFKYGASERFTVIGIDGMPRNQTAARFIELGDLPPRGEIKVFGLDPFSWTPQGLCWRSSRWQTNRSGTHRSSSGKWWSWRAQGELLRRWLKSSALHPGRLRLG